MKVIHVTVTDGKLTRIVKDTEDETYPDFDFKEFSDEALNRIVRDFTPQCEVK